jgi:hypothetical protein
MRKLIFAAQMRSSGGCAFAQQKSICAFAQQICSFLTSHMFLPAQMRKFVKKSPLSIPSLSCQGTKETLVISFALAFASGMLHEDVCSFPSQNVPTMRNEDA